MRACSRLLQLKFRCGDARAAAAEFVARLSRSRSSAEPLHANLLYGTIPKSVVVPRCITSPEPSYSTQEWLIETRRRENGYVHKCARIGGAPRARGVALTRLSTTYVAVNRVIYYVQRLPISANTTSG